MKPIDRRKMLTLSVGTVAGTAFGLGFGEKSFAADDSEFSQRDVLSNLPESPLKMLPWAFPYRWNIVPERERFYNGDDIEIFFRIPRNAKTARIIFPRGCAAAAGRVTSALGGLSFPWRRVGNFWERKIVFGWRARIVYGCGYAPRRASMNEVNSMMRTYRVEWTLIR
jgi:hypothetical protein